MQIRQIMRSPVVTVEPGTLLEEAVERLIRSGMPALPVIEDDALVGIVTDTDLYRAVAGERGVRPGGNADPDLCIRPRVVGDVMSRSVSWVRTTDAVDLAAALFMRPAHALPVLDHGRVVGLLTRIDVMAVLLGRRPTRWPERVAAPHGPMVLAR